MIFKVCYTAAKMLNELIKCPIQWIESKASYLAVSEPLEAPNSYLDSTFFEEDC